MASRPIGVLGAVAAAVLLASCGSTPSASRVTTTTAATAVVSAAGRAPMVVGRVQLDVPTTWFVATRYDAGCKDGQVICVVPCSAIQPHTITVDDGHVPLLYRACPSRARDSVWVFPASRRGTPSRRSLGVDGGAIVLRLPDLGAVLYGFGPRAVKVVEQYHASPLTRLLGVHLPTTVPRSWHRVHLGILSVAVPPGWPTNRLDAHRINPGTCGGAYFFRPAVFVGYGTSAIGCPLLLERSVLTGPYALGDGVWLMHVGHPFGNDVALGTSGSAVQRRFHRLVARLELPTTLLTSSVVQAIVTRGPRVGVLLLGLGTNVATAAAILSSVRLDAAS